MVSFVTARTVLSCLLLLICSSLWGKQYVLVVHSYHSGHTWTSWLKDGVHSVFEKEPNVIEYHEYLDAKRHPSLKHNSQFLDYLLKKYKNKPLDLIMVSDDAGLELLREERHRFFREVPIVYMGINNVDQGLIDTPGMTGVFENRDLAKTVFDIKLLTQSDSLIVITDQSYAGLGNLSKITAVKNDSRAPRNLYILDELANDDILKKLGDFDSVTPILLIGQVSNTADHNSLMSWNDGVRCITAAVPNPVFTIAITTMDHGATGADELGGRQHGRQAAELAVQILKGKDVADVKPVIKASSQWILNWQLLRKYQFKQEHIPVGARLIKIEESFYQKYKLLVWSVIGAFAVSLLIIILLVEVIRRGRLTRRVLAENEIRYKDLAHAGANIFWETDSQNRLIDVSGKTVELLGKSVDELKGCAFEEIMSDLQNVEFPRHQYREIVSLRLPLVHLIFKIKLDGGGFKVLMINGGPIFNSAKEFCGYRGICNDVTDEHHLSEKLAYQASYDSLTGLVNRTSFNTRLKEVVDEGAGSELISYVCFLDLDRFKLVNDTAGHLVGDAMLGRIAAVILSCIDSTDLLGRLGGDEFGLLLVGKTQAEAQAICELIIDEINLFRFLWNERSFSVGISIGMVSVMPGLTEIELLSKADLSCYKAKELGRGRVYVADPDNKDLYNDELEMGYIANVAQVIEQNQFFLMKQPIAPTENSEDHHHYEILIRFKDETNSVISPVVFIPAAEKHSVITLIDHWVVSTVLTRYHEFFEDGTFVSINLSGLSLSNEAFAKSIIDIVRQSKVPPHVICFEITETAVISNFTPALEFIHEMKSIGITFALDDFGSGASSFGYLKQLPVDYLKIDGSLVRNIVTEPTDRAIVSSIHSIAQMMGMKTIAEFVENDDIHNILSDIGIDYVQGYGIGKPVECSSC